MKVNYISAPPLCREKINKLMPRFILPLSSQRENNCRVNKHCLAWWLMDQFGSLIFTCRWWIHTDEAASGQKRILSWISSSSASAKQMAPRAAGLLHINAWLLCVAIWRSARWLGDFRDKYGFSFMLRRPSSQLRMVITYMQMRWRSFSMDASAACVHVWLVLESRTLKHAQFQLERTITHCFIESNWLV